MKLVWLNRMMAGARAQFVIFFRKLGVELVPNQVGNLLPDE